ncbi:MAG: tetratricopeptide repeat protein [Spirochaetales bacterium]|nr:tetratricopeptide repeat protein [Spirochaetales bacterium]
MSDKDDSTIKVSKILTAVLSLFNEGDFARAEAELEEALAIDYEHPDVLCAMRCAAYWKDRSQSFRQIDDLYESAEFLLKEWRLFVSFIQQKEHQYEQGLHALRQWVFGTALNNYRSLHDGSGVQDAEILFKIGRCYKGIGDYETALQYFEEANKRSRGSAEIIAELADSYALINEVKLAKAFFREAFFLNPAEVDVRYLESFIIQKLIESVRQKGYESPELEEWIPVYGILYGVFNVRRELKPLEFGKLKQQIFDLESEVTENRKILPRLLNKYFWLVEHYIHTREHRSKTEEILEKIRDLKPEIYEQYIN